MASGLMRGAKSDNYQYDDYSTTQTCTWIENSGGNSVVLVTLPKYLEIQEIYHHGDQEVAYYLGNPVLPEINAGDASTINTLVQN
jgi:hypothetical protein